MGSGMNVDEVPAIEPQRTRHAGQEVSEPFITFGQIFRSSELRDQRFDLTLAGKRLTTRIDPCSKEGDHPILEYGGYSLQSHRMSRSKLTRLYRLVVTHHFSHGFSNQ